MKIDNIFVALPLCIVIICHYVIPLSIAYITYCPCMGRLGNQIEQFLGMIAFAIKVNRTLVLPPWIMMSSLRTEFIPFGELFNITKLSSVHQVIPQEDFMTSIAPVVWPTDRRKVICWQPRSGPLVNDCNAKNGNPFKAFWDRFNVNFTGSTFYSPLSVESSKEQWDNLFPKEMYPVLAFVGPISAFPVNPKNRLYHRYLEWSDRINTLINQYIDQSLIKPIVGVHLRNGIDFLNACSYLKHTPKALFSSGQCHGDMNEFPPYKVTDSMCTPSKEIILQTILYAVGLIKARSVYIATDNNPMLSIIRQHLMNTTVEKVVWKTDSLPEEDMALLGRSDLTILNCISTYSAAIKRERDVKRLPSMFFGLTNEDQRGLEVLCTTSDSIHNWWLKFYRK
ncbi:unnamed protein product [Trichobilharzia szidati]|nr:unnamed protein product [Trichobilharzia szidati]